MSTRNADRPNGKAPKKHPKTGREGCNGKTKDGYTPAKAAERAAKRLNLDHLRKVGAE